MLILLVHSKVTKEDSILSDYNYPVYKPSNSKFYSDFSQAELSHSET